jgi:hypothetical protein
MFRFDSDALLLEPDSAEVHTLRGLVLFISNELPGALQDVSSAIELDPGHEFAKGLRERISHVKRLRSEGNVECENGNYWAAVAKFTMALDVRSPFVDVGRCHGSYDVFTQYIGTKPVEAMGGHVRAILLWNRSTSYLKVINSSEHVLVAALLSKFHQARRPQNLFGGLRRLPRPRTYVFESSSHAGPYKSFDEKLQGSSNRFSIRHQTRSSRTKRG